MIDKGHNEVLYYLHPEHLGGNLFATDTGGAKSSVQGYYAYGKTRWGNLQTDHRFTGQKYDNTGLYYYNARYYDPVIGTFISPDTLVPDPANLWDYNRFGYARLNPLKYNDPTGHAAGHAVHDSNAGPPVTLSTEAIGHIQEDYYNLDVAWADLPSDVLATMQANNVTQYWGELSGADATAQTGLKDPATIIAGTFAVWRLGSLAVRVLGLACGDGNCTNEATALQRAVDNGLRAVQSGAGRGYGSFNAFKAAEGPAGAGQAWHHIVGQQPANVARFGSRMIHNTNNLIRLPTGTGTIHQRITNYYNSIDYEVTGSTTMRVREWLAGQSFEAQWKFGIELIKRFGGNQYIIQQFGGGQ